MGLGPKNIRGKLFAGAMIFAGTIAAALLTTSPVDAAAGINQQMNFQGRLLNGQGAVAPDGFYNIQFKIYQDGDGQSVGNTTGSPAGTLKWTENYLNSESHGVRVVNGFLSVQLGSINPFGSNIDWNQDTIWLSMNIGNTNTTCTPFASCTPDGEMVPMKRMSATAYALNAANANSLGGLTASGFIQNGTNVQSSANFNISGSGTVGTDMNVGNNLAVNGNGLSYTKGYFNVGTTSTGNLLTNPGFETNMTGWSNLSATSARVTATGAIYQGAAGAEVTTSAASSSGIFASGNAVTAGNGYVFSAYVKASSVAGAATIRTNIEWKDSGGATLSTTTGTTTSINTNWQRLSVSGTAPANAVNATVTLYTLANTTGDKFYVDAAQFETGTVLTPYTAAVHAAGDLTVGGAFAVQGASTLNGSVALTTSSATSVGLLLISAASQSADLIQLKDASGNVKSGFDALGRLYLGSASLPSSANGARLFVTQATSTAPLQVNRGTGSQTGDLLQFQDVNGATLSKIDANGQSISYGTSQQILGLATPTFTTSSSGSTYYYVITATNAAGETVASTSLGMLNNTSALNWTAVNGATGYKIYRNTSNAFTTGSLLLTTITNGTTISYTDTGSATAAGLPPTAPNGSKLLVQGWQAQSGNLLLLQDSTGSGLFAVDVSGRAALGGSIDTTTKFGVSSGLATALRVTSTSASTTGQIIKANTTQTSNLLELQDASNNVLSGFAGNGQLFLGRASGQTGSMKFYNATNANTVTLQSGTTTTAYNLTLPTALGSSNQCLIDTTGTGVLGFATCATGSSSAVSTIGTIDTQTKSTDGAVISGSTLYLQTADQAKPGLVSTAAQTFAGTKTFNGGVNLATGQALQVNGVNVLTSGSLSFTSAATATVQSASGQALAINAGINNATSINTGTSTGLVSIGGGAGTFALDTTNIDISAAGAITGATGITSSGTIQGGTVNATSGYQVNGTAGSAVACTGGQFLQNATVSGGILTAGSCATASNGVTTIGAFVATTSYANGAQISGNTLTFGAADGTNPGLLSTAAQTIAGDKTFTGSSVFNGTFSQTTGTNADSHAINSANTAGTQANGILFNRNGAGGTTTNGVNISNTAGTLTNGLAFTGTIGTDITRGSGTLTIQGAGGVQISSSGGSVTLASDVSISSGKSITYVGGASNFDQSASTGTFKTGSGAVSLNGDSTVAANKNFSLAAGTGTITQTYSGTGAGSATTINATNTTGTITNGITFNRNAAGGTTTNGLNISNSAGTLTNGVAFTGTIGTDITRGTGTLTIQGAGGVQLSSSGGSISLASDTVVAAGKNFSLAAGSGTFSQSFNTAGAGTAHTVTASNTSGTQTNGILFDRNGAGGTTTNGVNISNTAGTLTNGLQFTGTMTNLINATNFTVTNAGDLTAAGTVRANTAFNINGTTGASTACSGGTFLQNATVVGGITTGGTCVAASNGVTTIGTFVATTSYANGAIIGTNTITFGAADTTNPGLVSTAAQTFAGNKVFTGTLGIGSAATNQQLTLTGGATSHGIELGRTDGTASNPYFDFHSSGSANDYDGRIIATGGSATLGQGNLTFQAATTNVSGTLQTGGTNRLDNAGNLINIVSGSGVASATTGVAGGTLSLQGGNATVGNANGGTLNLSGGTGIGTGVNGLVVISTPTFATTTNDANCYTGGAVVTASCTITSASVNGSSAIIVGFNATGLVATLPDPSIVTAGRVVYVTAANGSSDFTLRVNGGGQGNDIAMRQNTTATMIWNGADWTAAGASSSTTLQAAYDNTLQSAGGAELVVSKTSATNGLTIRESSTNPVNGTLLSVQTASAAGLLSVNSNVTEYASNAGAETAGGSSTTFPASTWSSVGASTVTRNTTTTNNSIATGQASVGVTTTAVANDGVKNTLSTALTAGTTYNLSFATRLSAGTFTDMNVYYSINGTAASVACTTAATAATSIWTKVNCAFTAPTSGITATNAILIRQTAGSNRTFYVDNMSVTIAADYNYATDGGVDDATNFTTNWSAVAGSTVTRDTGVGNDASDSAKIVTTAVNQGVRNKLSINPLAGTLYRVTVYAASTTSGFGGFTARYSRDGGTNFVNCADYNTQTVSSSVTAFTKITCYITTDGTAATNPYIYFTQNDSTGRTFYVDTFSFNLSSNSTPNVQIGGGLNGGPTTLFTLDKGASAPIASNNDALLGSMYYDTTLGKLQCYEADGWGACGSSPDNIVTISPEYTNAVLHGTGIGTMTSDICSSTLNINNGTSGQPTICGANETYNFYKWTSPQASAQTYSIYVTYQLPTTFKSFSSGQTSLMGRTDSTNSTVRYQVYRNTSTGLLACGTTVAVSTGSVSSWQTGVASGAADPSTCSFAPGDSIVFKIDVVANSNANAYVGNLNFTFNNK